MPTEGRGCGRVDPTDRETGGWDGRTGAAGGPEADRASLLSWYGA